MPKTKKGLGKKAEKVIVEKPKKISPFKDHAEFEKEIVDFANKFRTTVAEHAKRTSDYFEMSCFNYIVKYYELLGYNLTVENLQNSQYRYKCSPMGIQSNYSFFKASFDLGPDILEFEIQHNLAVQSSHDEGLFTTPDISIIRSNTVKESTEHYDTKIRFCYVENEDLLSFCEVKQFTPFPELLFNFIGVVNELRKDIMTDSAEERTPPHIAPSLMISGKPSKPSIKIRDGLQSRYCINIIFDLFESGSATFSQQFHTALRQCGKVPLVPIRLEKEDFEKGFAVGDKDKPKYQELEESKIGMQLTVF